MWQQKSWKVTLLSQATWLSGVRSRWGSFSVCVLGGVSFPHTKVKVAEVPRFLKDSE